MDEIKKLLEAIKKPRIRLDKDESIEREVGDSVTSAYNVGFYDGNRMGQYELAQKLLKAIGGNG